MLYGGLGTIVGHEFTHGFDNEGFKDIITFYLAYLYIHVYIIFTQNLPHNNCVI